MSFRRHGLFLIFSILVLISTGVRAQEAPTPEPPTPTAIPTDLPTNTPTATPTQTFTPEPSLTPLPSATLTETAAPTVTAEPTLTATETPFIPESPTETQTPTATETPFLFSAEATAEVTPSASPTTTLTLTPTVMPTTTPIPSPTAMPTAADVTTYTVNVTDDNSDGVCDATHCSLREAITLSNASAGKNAISFNIPGNTPHTISPTFALPTITDPYLIIDGTTQPGFAGTPVIVISGANLGSVDGLTITASRTTVRGLVIVRWGGEGIKIANTYGIFIEGNYIGVDPTGMIAQGNGRNGILLNNSSSNHIGGNTPAQRNVISGNGMNGIYMDGQSSIINEIEGNYIGVNAAGTGDLGNVGIGVSLNNAERNNIGGETNAQRNIISGNDGGAVSIVGGSNIGESNRLSGNFIGSDVSGTQVIANGSPTIRVAASSNSIGGSGAITPGGACTGSCNLIVANGGIGLLLQTGGAYVSNSYFGVNASGTASLGYFDTAIRVQSSTNNIWSRNVIASYVTAGITITQSSNFVWGNYIGTDTTGTVDLVPSANAVGILITGATAKNNEIGRVNSSNSCAITSDTSCNVIAGNNVGILLNQTASANKIRSNFIGLNMSGTAAIPNNIGISFDNSSSNIVGTYPLVANSSNYISGNTDGILIKNSSSNTIQGNYIGLASNRTSAIGNMDDGVEVISGNNNNIAQSNVIANNGDNGVIIQTASTGNRINANNIYGNGGMGIELLPVGVTPNDTGDGDTGANGLQNFPVLTNAVTVGSSTTVSGTLNSKPNLTYTIEFFSNTVCEASGYGEGQTYLGFITATTDATGNVSFSANVSSTNSKLITAVATDPSGNTSEFSGCINNLSAPTLLKLTATSATSINLSWADNSNVETEYRIERSFDGTTNWAEIAAQPADSTTYTDSTITCGLPYYYRVRAYRSSPAQFSGYTSVASTMTLCSLNAPTVLSVTGTQANQVGLSWVDNATGESEYDVERSPDGVNNWTLIISRPDNAVSYTDTAVTCETTYFYRVRARHFNGQTTDYSNVINAQTLLCAPTALASVLTTDTQINLTWVDKSSSETAYKIERSTDNSVTWNEIASIEANTTAYSDNTIACNKLYSYRVRAYRNGDGKYSAYNSTTSNILTPKCAPADLSITKTVSNATPGENDSINYVLTLTNSGPNVAGNVVVRDQLPTTTLFVSSLGSQGTYDANTKLWTVGNVASNTSVTMTITVRIAAATAGTTINNTAEVWASDATDPDSTPGNNSTVEDDQSKVSVNAACATASIFNVAANDTAGLIAAIAAANNETCFPGANTINLAANSTYNLTQVYVNDQNGSSGLPTINTTITIEGNGSTIQRSTAGGTPAFRILTVSGSSTQAGVGGNLTLNRVTVSNGLANQTNTTYSNYGGGILNIFGTLKISNSVISNSSTNNRGGGLYTRGTDVTITSSLFLANSSTSSGLGAAIFNDGNLTVTNSTFSANVASNTSSSVVYHNYAASSLILTHNTFVDNVLPSSAGVIRRNSGSIKLRGNLFSNASNSCAGGSIISEGYNYSNDGSCGVYFNQPTDIINATLGLSILTDNAGYTKAYTLRPDSIALDAIPGAECTLTTDQSGLTRPIDSDNNGSANCDVGALEMGWADLQLDKNVNSPTAMVGDNLTFTIQLTNNGPTHAYGVIVADPLPTTLTYVSSSASKGTFDPANGLWRIGQVNVGESVTLSLQTQVNYTGAGSSILNNANVVAASVNRPLATSNDTTTTTIGSCAASVSFNIANGDVNGLINAIAAANNEVCYAGANTIHLAANGSYTVTAIYEDGSGEASGFPVITSDIVIDGHGATIQRESTAPAFRIFTVANGAHLTVKDARVNGGASTNGGGISNAGTLDLINTNLTGNSASGQGGGVYNNGTMTVTGGTFSNNTSGSGGGGIATQGSLTMSNANLADNTAAGGVVWGGGVKVINGTANITASTFVRNIATVSDTQGGGGAIANFGSLTLTGSTINNNQAVGAASLGGGLFINNTGSATVSTTTFDGNGAPSGAGIYNDLGTLNLSTSTVSNNTAAAQGGGIYGSGTINITNSTISTNTAATNGGGLGVVAATVQIKFSTIASNTAANGSAISNNAATTVTASILANNSGDNCSAGGVTSGGYNLSDDISCNLSGTGDKNSIDPLLGVLANNGGTTKTHALLNTSVAFNNVATAACTAATDQRGTARPQGAGCDSGAVEGNGTPAYPNLSISNLNNAADTGDGKLLEGEIVDVSVTQFFVTFNRTPANPAGNTASNDVTNPANYRLVRDGANAIFQTTTCSTVGGDDIAVAINSVTYHDATLTATVTVNGGVELPADDYRLLVCSNLQDVNGIALDGDKNGIAGDNFIRGFSNDPVRYNADLAVTQTDNPDPVLTNGTLTYTVTVANPNGPQKALNVVLTDTIPSGVTFVSASGCTFNNGIVTCNLGTILRGQSKNVTITLTVGATTIATLTNKATATSSTTDPSPANNTNILQTTDANEPMATNLIVNTASGGRDGVCGVIHCSLSDAITSANLRAGVDTILFNISGSGPYIILLDDSLPAISEAVILDGWSQPGFNNKPIIEIDGSRLTAANGIVVGAGGSTIRGFVIHSFENDGLVLNNVGNNIVVGNYIGTDLTGTTAKGNRDGIKIADSGNNTIGGLTPKERNVVSGNEYWGVHVSGATATGNVVQGNFIGTTATGTAGLANMFGINVAASNTTVGGTAGTTPGGDCTGACNLISYNLRTGISINHLTDYVLVQGNYIGTDVTGKIGLGNGSGTWTGNPASQSGIYLDGGGHANTVIGGDTPATRNIISGNRIYGIYAATGSAQTNSQATIKGNYIGTDVTGSLSIPNQNGGMMLYTANNAILNNLVSGNTGGGIDVRTGPNTIRGNYIGTNAAGNVALPNGGGINVNDSGVIIGGVVPGQGNVISGNNGTAISLGSNATIYGNRIGTDITGTLALGNNGYGVYAYGSNNIIGGINAGEANTIANNNKTGVYFFYTATNNNPIRGNAIYSNNGMGINLQLTNSGADDGVTANDVGDADTGGNKAQNYPVLTGVSFSSGQVTVNGTLNSTANATFELDFYINDECDATGHGEGKIYLGHSTQTTNASGDVSFSVTLPTTLSAGYYVTATATDSTGNTSEFSACITSFKAPSELTVQRISSSEMQLNWTDNNPDEAGFRVERSLSGTGGWTEVDALDANTTTYNQAGLTCDTTYFYRVRAESGTAGEFSGYSNIVSIRPCSQTGPVFTLTSNANTDDGYCDYTHCTLREAINGANQRTGTQTINLATNTAYTLNAVDNNTNGPTGLPIVTGDIVINGYGATIERSTATGTPVFRIVQVAASGKLTLNDLTIRNGDVATGVSQSWPQSYGGGIANLGGLVTVNRSTISNNIADYGGGISNMSLGTLVVTNSAILNNYGGGVGNNPKNQYERAGTVTITNSTFSSSLSSTNGVFNGFSGNLAISYSTFVSNSNNGTLLANSGPTGSFTILGSIFVDTGTALVCYGNTPNITSLGYNIVNDDSCDIASTGDLTSTNPVLGSLGNNGGSTQTHLLQPSSPAIDNIPAANCTAEFDQRGIARPIDGNSNAIADCDSGAYETSTLVIADLSLTMAVSKPQPAIGENITYTLTLTNSGPEGASGIVVKDVLPAGLTFTSATTSQGTYVNSTGIWTVNTLAANGIATLSIQAKINDGQFGLSIQNTAQVTESSAIDLDSTPNNNVTEDDQASVTITVACSTSPLIVAAGDTAGLIYALKLANDELCFPGANTITLTAGSPYMLTAVDNNDGGLNGLPSVKTEIIINGNGATIERSTAEGVSPFRFVRISTTGNLTLNQVNMVGGNSTGNGGAILNQGVLTVVSSVFSGNTATGEGGAIYTLLNRQLSVTDSLFTNNTGYNGGALYNYKGSVVTLTNTEFTQNNSQQSGGAIFNRGQLSIVASGSDGFLGNVAGAGGGAITNDGTGILTVNDSAFANNTGNGGGAIENENGTATITNSTIFNNVSINSNGHAVLNNFGTVTIQNSTLSGNNPDGSLLYVYSGSVRLKASILYSSFGVNCYTRGAGIYSDGYNITNDGSCSAYLSQPTDQNGVNPSLGAPTNNGGNTQTQALAVNSLAIDALPAVLCGTNSDQRGYSRPQGNGCDIGAYEAQSSLPVPANLIKTLSTASAVTLQWNDTPNETEFQVERSADGLSGWEKVAAVNANETSYTDSNLVCSQSISYRVRAYRSSEDLLSLPSNIVRVTTSACLAADLGITVVQASNTLIVGGTQTYTLSVRNLSANPAYNVVITNTIPAGTTYESATTSIPMTCTQAYGVVTCNAAKLNANSTQTIAIKVNLEPATRGPLTNTAAVQSLSPDSVMSNNSASVTTSSVIGRLATGIYQDNSPDLAYTGNWITFTGSAAKDGTFKYTNGDKAQVTFAVNNSVGRIIIYRTTHSTYGTTQIFMDGAATPIATMNNTSSTMLFGVPFTLTIPSGNHLIELRNVGTAYSSIDQIDLLASAEVFSAATSVYQDTEPSLNYSGVWVTGNNASALEGTRTYTNDPNATVSFSIDNSVGRVTIFRTTYADGVYGSMQVFVDGVLNSTINNTSAAFLFGQPFTFAVTPGSHVITLKNVGSTYSDIDQITLEAPPVALGVGIYPEIEPNLTYSGTWTQNNNPSAIDGARKFTNDPNGSVTFSINNTVGRVTIFRTIYSAGVYGSMQVFVDGVLTSTINNTSAAFLFGQPFTFAVTPGSHVITLKNVGSTYSDIDQITLAPASPLAVGTVQESDAKLIYNGAWTQNNNPSAISGARKFTNDPNGSVTFSIDNTIGRVTIFRTTYSAGVYGSMQVFVDGVLNSTINNTSAAFLFGQPFTFAVTPGNHVITLKNVGSTYSDIDQITLEAPPVALGVGIYPEIEPNLTYSGAWTQNNNPSAIDGARKFTNDPNGSLTFSINNTVGRVTIFRTTYSAGVYGSMQVFVDGVLNSTINNTSAAFLFGQPFTFAVTPGNHVITLKNVGSTYSDIDQITLAPASPLAIGTVQETDAKLIYNGAWTQNNNPSAIDGARKFTNDPNGSVSFSIDNSVGRVTIFRTTYSAGVYGSMQVFVDGVLTATINNTSAAFLFGQPFTFAITPGSHVITLKNVGSTYSDIDQITLAPASLLAISTVQETDAKLIYNGAWTQNNNPSAIDGARKFTNDPNGSVSFSVDNTVGRVTIFRTTYSAGVYGSMQVFVDGVLTSTINNTSAAFLFGQPFTFAVTPGNHVITLKNVGSTYSDIDQITLAPASPLAVGTVQETDAKLIYNGAWTQNNNPSAIDGARKFTNDPNGSVTFSIDNTVGRVTIFRTTYSAGVYGSMQVFVDGVLTATINNTSAAFLFGQPFTFTVTPGSHVITLKNVGSTYSDIDQITLGAE